MVNDFTLPTTRRIGTLRLCWGMIFSENRFPLFGIMPTGTFAAAARIRRGRHAMNRRLAGVVAGVVAAMIVSAPARAQSVAEFYQGKDIRILIGAGVGGTYHLYATL